MKLLTFTVGTWILFMITAVNNAGIRNVVYKPIVGDLVAHQISTFLLILIILLVTYILLQHFRLKFSTSNALMVGFMWVSCTILFEFTTCFYIFVDSWDKL
jgi:ABC-type uncharacterized transport system permease subunit